MGVLLRFYVLFRIVVDVLIDFFFGLYYRNKRGKVPPIKNQLLLDSACVLTRKIRERSVTVYEVIETYVERCKEVNKFINAVVDDRFNGALLDAKRMDEDIKNGKITDEYFDSHPFFGVPFTTKESTSSKGFRWTFGLVSRKKMFADEDAEIVRLLKKAGAIQIGVTNVPQLNFWMESYNPVYGTCCNPYDFTRNAGGSSGGEASIIAACGVPIGIGSDVAGSIRIPSLRCGIFGHKPTTGIISTKGLTYNTGNGGPTIGTAGPMVKRADDLLPLLKVLAGDNAKQLKLDQKIDVKNINIYYQREMFCPFSSPIKKEMQTAVLKAAKYLNSATNRKPYEVMFEDTKYSLLLWSYMLRKENGDISFDLSNRKYKVSAFSAFVKFFMGNSDYNLYSIYNLMNVLTVPVNEQWAKETLDKLKTKVLDILKDNGVLLFPSEPFAASYHYTSLLRPYNLTCYCLWNALDIPVTQVPMGLNKEGLPIGIQVVTAPNQDHLSIAVARELEKGLGGYVNCFD